MLAPPTIYKFNVENLRSISTAIVQIKRSIHQAIATENQQLVSSFTCLFALSLGAWAETRLRKLLYEANGFSEQDRIIINEETNQFNKWKKSIELAIRSHYAIPTAPLTDINLTHSVFSRYSTLMSILETDLKPVIEIRNKLAHGQWVFPFTSSLELSTEHKTSIERENTLSLQFKHSILVHLSQIIHDLVVSRPTFERDFDSNYRKLSGTKQNLENRPFDNYCTQLKTRYSRGKEKRKLNTLRAHISA